jgi:Uma2 family endonuclease
MVLYAYVCKSVPYLGGRPVTTKTLRRQFTVHDYARMREAGILTEDDRVELLDGEIYLMSPLGPLHIAIVNRLNKLLMRQIGDDAIVSIQNAVQLNDYSEPQPDIALLHPRDDYYDQALARPDDILLLIEVADTSLDYDRDQKLPRYAVSNIAEVWIVDVEQQVVEQYFQPLQGQYTQLTKILFGNALQSRTLPQIDLSTDQIF